MWITWWSQAISCVTWQVGGAVGALVISRQFSPAQMPIMVSGMVIGIRGWQGVWVRVDPCDKHHEFVCHFKIVPTPIEGKLFINVPYICCVGWQMQFKQACMIWSSAHLVILSLDPILSDIYGPSFQGIMMPNLALFSYCRWSVCIQLLFTLSFTTSLLYWWRNNYWLWWISIKAVRTRPSLSGGVLTMRRCKDAVEVHCCVVISVEINGASHSRKYSIIQDIYLYQLIWTNDADMLSSILHLTWILSPHFTLLLQSLLIDIVYRRCYCVCQVKLIISSAGVYGSSFTGQQFVLSLGSHCLYLRLTGICNMLVSKGLTYWTSKISQGRINQ